LATRVAGRAGPIVGLALMGLGALRGLTGAFLGGLWFLVTVCDVMAREVVHVAPALRSREPSPSPGTCSRTTPMPARARGPRSSRAGTRSNVVGGPCLGRATVDTSGLRRLPVSTRRPVWPRPRRPTRTTAAVGVG
jgi:hypothetical protein